MGQRLAGKVVVILGAGSSAPGMGIGRTNAVYCAREGARLVLVDRAPDALAGTEQLVWDSGAECLGVVADVTRFDAMEAVIAQSCSAFGRVDVVQNNIGRGGGGGPLAISVDDWHATLTLNLDPAFFAVKAALPVMLEQGSGAFVHIGSVAGIRYSGAAAVAYQTAKAGLIALSRGVAIEFAARGIRSNCILPGHVDTPEIEQRLAQRHGADQVPELMRRRGLASPQGHSASTADIAHAVIYLASDEARHVNGTELVIDGGKTAYCGQPYAPST